MSDEPIRRGQQAQRILDDDLVKEAMAFLRDHAYGEFKAASPDNDTALRTARIRLAVTEDFVNFFYGVIRDGEYALSKQK